MTVKESTSYGATSASPAPTNVQVIAPATLEAGYTFDAMYEGTTFTVVVPDGGVIKGQRFIVPFTTPVAEAVAVPVDGASGGVMNARRRHHNTAPGAGYASPSIPTGIWRDGLCDCCRFGPFHPSLLNSLFFRPFIMGQLMTRMKMTWLGFRTRSNAEGNLNMNDSRIEVDGRYKVTFRNIAIVTVLFYVVTTFTATPTQVDPKDISSMPTYDDLSDVDKVKYTINSGTSALFGVFMFYLLIQLRATLRHVYSIPEESCLFWYQLGISGNNPREGICGSGGRDNNNKCCTAGVPIGWEDVCCAMWCQCCIVAQMARHTVDYEERNAVCCNGTGVNYWDDDEAYEGIEAGVGEGSVLVV